MQIVHLADTHVGAKPYHIDELQRHILDAFDEAIEYTIKVKPKVLIIAGDLFDKPRPENQVFIHVLRSIKRIVNKGIKVVIAHGEHDTPGRRDRTVLEVIAEAVEGVYAPRISGGALEDRAEQSVFEIDGLTVGVYQFYKTHIENQRNFAKNLLPIYSRILSHKKKPRIFVAHIGVEGALIEDAAVANLRDLPQVEYAALGHHHGRWIQRPEDGPRLAVYPGSLYPLNIREARSNHKRGPILVDLSGDEPVIQEEYAIEVARHIVLPEVRLSDPLQVESRLKEIVLRSVGQAGGKTVLHAQILLSSSIPRARVESALLKIWKTYGVIVIPHITRQVVMAKEDREEVLELELDPVELIRRYYKVTEESARLIIALKDALSRGDIEEANMIIDELTQRGELLRIAKEKGVR